MHKTAAIANPIYSAIVTTTTSIAPHISTAIASKNTTNSPNGAKLNIVIILLVSIFFIAYANIENIFDFCKFYGGNMQKSPINANKLSHKATTGNIDTYTARCYSEN